MMIVSILSFTMLTTHHHQKESNNNKNEKSLDRLHAKKGLIENYTM